jgi:acetyltransferase-like isoleucine patch superfamily enzyme
MRWVHQMLQNCVELVALARGRWRASIWRLRGAKIAEKVSLGSRCRIDCPWCLQIGGRTLAESDVYMKIVDDNAAVKIGEYVFIGKGTEFDIREQLTIGDHTIIAPGCFITDHNHGTLQELRIDQQPCISKPVTIGEDVWLGAGVVILPGVNIGDGAVIGANAVVTKDVASMTVVVGVPAEFIRSRAHQKQD